MLFLSLMTQLTKKVDLWHKLRKERQFIVGNNKTSLMLASSVNNITNLSIPIPNPPVGGIPYSSAVICISYIYALIL